MLVEEYSKEFCRPPNPGAEHLRCVAYLNTDITKVLPYLNTLLGGHQYFNDPPSLTLKLPGKLVTLYPRKIAINILKDEQEADSILQWLQQEINETWEKRETICPTFTVRSQPRVLDILKMLPKTNCGKCGKPTCMVFAVAVSEGSCIMADCPSMDEHSKEKSKTALPGAVTKA